MVGATGFEPATHRINLLIYSFLPSFSLGDDMVTLCLFFNGIADELVLNFSRSACEYLSDIFGVLWPRALLTKNSVVPLFARNSCSESTNIS